jgi:hypothetical protein
MEIGNPNAEKRMKNKYFLFYCLYPYKKKMEVSTESEEQHSQRELRPISFQSGLEAKQTSLPHGDMLYSCSAVTEHFLSPFLALFYT